MAVFPLLRTASTEKCEEFGKGSVHLFFFTRGECPGMSTLSEHFQRRDIICTFPISHKLFSSHLRAFGWLTLTNSFSACMGCCVASWIVMKTYAGRGRNLECSVFIHD